MAIAVRKQQLPAGVYGAQGSQPSNAFVGPLLNGLGTQRQVAGTGFTNVPNSNPFVGPMPMQGPVRPGTNVSTVSSRSNVPAPELTFEELLQQYQQELINSSSESSGGGAQAAAYQPQYTVYNGRGYDLNDQQQRQDFFAAKQADLLSIRDQLIADADKNASTATGQARDSYSQQLAQIDQQLQDIGTQAQEYATKYKQTVNQFGQDKAVGDVQRGQQFAALSPNAFQSSQATSSDFANQQYLQGLGDLATQAESTVGSKFLDTGNAADLVSGSTFGKSLSGTQQSRSGLGNAYDTYLKNISDTTSKAYQTANQFVTDNANSTANTLGAIDMQQGYNPFAYTANSQVPTGVPQIDISRYTPYTNFQSLSGVPQTGAGGYKAPVSSNPFKTGSSVDSYLGRSNVTSPNDQSFLKKYLLGKSGF